MCFANTLWGNHIYLSFIFFSCSVEDVCLSVFDLVIVWAEEVGLFELPCNSYIV